MAHTLSRRKREKLEQDRRREEAEKFRNSTEAIREDGAALIEAWKPGSPPAASTGIPSSPSPA
jgi:hypothetical protein